MAEDIAKIVKKSKTMSVHGFGDFGDDLRHNRVLSAHVSGVLCYDRGRSCM